MKVLWLVSWYPDPYEPANGDFVQRHAKAVATLLPLDVIHVVQVGKDIKTSNRCLYHNENNLREWVYSFSFTRWGVGWIDRVFYHIRFCNFYHTLLLEYAAKNGKPDLIHLHVPMKAGIITREIAALWKIPYIVTEHSSLYDPVAIDNFGNRSFFFRYYTRKIFQDAVRITCVSSAIGNRIGKMLNDRKVEIIHNVVDTSLFNYQHPPFAGFKWLHVSSMQPMKNVAAILKAFQLLYTIRQDWKLELIGPMENLPVKWLIDTGLTDHIIFKGEMSHSEVAKKMKESSAVVLFSKYENFPCVISEALCCGLPVVSSDVGGIGEALNKNNGILVESENIFSLTAALSYVMANYGRYDRNLIAREAALKYGVAVIARQFIDLYNIFNK